jgi:hypothetical protein
MRKLKTVVKMTILPVACFACIAWVAGFVVIAFKLPNHNVGLMTLTILTGLVLVFPWVTLVVALLRRMAGSSDAVPAVADGEP